MSLYIYFNDEPLPKNLEIINDVDARYSMIPEYITDESAKVISDIDGARDAKDGVHFIDRWGAYEAWENLSTGSKAAVIISLAKPNECINTIECGANALKSIIKHIKNGRIVMQYPVFSMPYTDIDIVLHNKRFTNGKELNTYIKEECL